MVYCAKVIVFYDIMRALISLILSTLLVLAVGIAHADGDFKQIEQTFSDSVITTKITAKFTKDANLNPLKISVSTHKGIVKLAGHVNNRKAFVQALRLTKNTKGVRGVNISNLMIKEVNTSLTDAYITAKVEAAVLKAKVFDDESIPLVGINASTVNGVVTLAGEVKQKSSIPAIVKRVKVVRGVKQVIPHLRIAKQS